jgi:hypothetical protein
MDMAERIMNYGSFLTDKKIHATDTLKNVP